MPTLSIPQGALQAYEGLMQSVLVLHDEDPSAAAIARSLAPAMAPATGRRPMDKGEEGPGGKEPPQASPLALISYLNFIRRNYVRQSQHSQPQTERGMGWETIVLGVQGVEEWRRAFSDATELPPSLFSWEAVIAQALREWRMAGGETTTRRKEAVMDTLRVGRQRFRLNGHFMLAWADLLVDMGDIDGR